jgi:hypothetical protein
VNDGIDVSCISNLSEILSPSSRPVLGWCYTADDSEIIFMAKWRIFCDHFVVKMKTVGIFETSAVQPASTRCYYQKYDLHLYLYIRLALDCFEFCACTAGYIIMWHVCT